MGMNPETTVLVYVNSTGVYIHHLFAKRHGIKEGADVHRSVLERHAREVPEEERAEMSQWIHPDDQPFLSPNSITYRFGFAVLKPQRVKINST